MTMESAGLLVLPAEAVLFQLAGSLKAFLSTPSQSILSSMLRGDHAVDSALGADATGVAVTTAAMAMMRNLVATMLMTSGARSVTELLRRFCDVWEKVGLMF